MGVLTSSEFFGEKPKVGVVEGNAPVMRKRPEDADILAFKFKSAPKGRCTAHLPNPFEEGASLKMPLEDGVFVIPKKWDKAKRLVFKKHLADHDDWEEVSYLYDEGQAKPKKSSKKETVVFYAGHPDNTTSNKIEGEVVAVVTGEDGSKTEHKLKCVKGIVTTADKAVYDSLISQGYHEAKPPKKGKK